MTLKHFRRKNIFIPLFLAVALLLATSSSIAMSFQMDDKECSKPAACEMCCMVYLPAPVKLDLEKKFIPVRSLLKISFPESQPFGIYHPPKAFN